MIERCIDTNVFIRNLVGPRDAEGIHRHYAANALFQRVERREERVVTAECCLAEIVYVLTSKRQYGLPRSFAETALRSLLSMRNLTVVGPRRYGHALDLYATHPKLDFDDAVIAALALELGLPLLSYDTGLDEVPGLVRHEPEQAEQATP